MLTESWVEGKSVEEKDAQPAERTAALWGLSSKLDSRTWVNFTRNGLKLGSRHQEPPHTDVSRNLATVVVRGVLPGLRRRRTGLLPSGPKSSFQMRASFVFNLETKVLESGGRVEKLIAQVAWSPVLSFHSLWWFGVQCHLLVLVHSGSGCLCLWVPRGHGESWTDQLILPLASSGLEPRQRLYSRTLCQTMEPGKRAPHTQTPPRSATGQVPAFHLAALPRVRRWSRLYGVWVPGSQCCQLFSMESN